MLYYLDVDKKPLVHCSNQNTDYLIIIWLLFLSNWQKSSISQKVNYQCFHCKHIKDKTG